MFFTLFREPLWGGVRIFASIEISLFVKTEFSCMITWIGFMLLHRYFFGHAISINFANVMNDPTKLNFFRKRRSYNRGNIIPRNISQMIVVKWKIP